jgi:hypothetical protein
MTVKSVDINGKEKNSLFQKQTTGKFMKKATKGRDKVWFV